MKKFSILAVLVMMLCFCTSSYGADAAGHEWYMGIGGSWALENIDEGDLPDEVVDFDDGYGFQAKVGYHLNDNFSLGLIFDYVTGIDSDESESGRYDKSELEIDVDAWTLMLEGKASMSGTMSPYAVVGVGIMGAGIDGKYTYTDLDGIDPDESDTEKFDEDDTIACGKVGLGVDWWAAPDLTVGLEGAYVFGFGDADFDGLEMGIDYFTIALGIAYHF